jgi:ubiquitin-conjugating enzyme E2 O
LSLLGTWEGRGECEQWSEKSSLVQLLLSIQGLVLCDYPYFNEAGYEAQVGTAVGLHNARLYNENVRTVHAVTYCSYYTVKLYITPHLLLFHSHILL